MTFLASSRQSIFTPKRLIKLAATDLRNILRDPTLIMVLIFSVLPVILFYFFKTQMNEVALSSFGLSNISIFVAPVFLLIPAYLIGWIIGFLSLEERDEGALMALEVTPIGKQGVAIYRALFAFSITFTLSLIAAPIFFTNIALHAAILLSLFTALQAVMVTFAIPAIANNKVQGLALTKVINLFTLAPLLAIFASPWRYIAGVLPSFWIGEYLSLSEIDFLPLPAIALVGIAVHVGAIAFFYQRFLSKT